MCALDFEALDRQEPDVGSSLTDPLHVSVPLSFSHVLYPYGFPVRIQANDPRVIRAAELSWAAYPQRFREKPIEIRIIVSTYQAAGKLTPPQFRAQGNLLGLVSDRRNFGCCDLSGGFGYASVSSGLVGSQDFFRYHFLEAMAYTLLDTRHLLAVHAACVGWEGRGMLLAGDSGAGKSSLAYACARRGWTYTADDSTSVVLRCQDRTVVGNPATFRFRPEAPALFPELRGRLSRRNGKPTLTVETENLPGITIAHQQNIQFIVFLRRSARWETRCELLPLSRKDSFRRLFVNPWPPELAIHATRLAAMERLLGAPGFELRYNDFDPAIASLRELTQQTRLPSP